jgi:hypothetical protein
MSFVFAPASAELRIGAPLRNALHDPDYSRLREQVLALLQQVSSLTELEIQRPSEDGVLHMPPRTETS